MLPSHIVLLIRKMQRSKLISSIQILSLVMANIAAILVLLYVVDELSYDKFHENRDRVYKVVSKIKDAKSGEVQTMIEANSWPVGYTLRNEYPEVDKVVYGRTGAYLQVSHNNELIQENVLYMSEEFLQVFSFPMINGDPESALSEPYSAVLTPEIAEKYFPKGDALGKVITMNDSIQMTVTGIVECPANSHIQFGILISFGTFEEMNPNFSYTSDNGWGNFNIWNYVLLKEGVNHSQFIEKGSKLFQDKAGEMAAKMGVSVDLEFESLNDYYLDSEYGNGLGPSGDISRIKLISAIGALIILLASINFINLSTARSVFRAKEVGIRKLVGSSRSRLVRQFLIESYLLTGIAFILAVGIAYMVLPYYNMIIGKTYSLSSLFQTEILLSVTLTVALIGLISGYYPALFISKFQPSQILKGRFHTGQRGVRLRRVLVVFQFFICSALIVGVLLSNDQLSYMHNYPKGFNQEQLVALDMRSIPNSKLQQGIEAVKNDLNQLPYLEHQTFTAALPGRQGWDGQWCSVEGMEADENLTVHFIPVDEEFLNTFEMEIIAGRDFDIKKASDVNTGLLINEKIVEMVGWSSPEEAIGKKISSPSGYPSGEIIGVVANFHQDGLQEEISPIVMDHLTQVSKYIVARYNINETSNMVDDLKIIWEKHFPEAEFNYFFVDDNFNQQYKTEERLANVITLFTLIAIFIAIIGLIGLISYVITARKRELGIRRILGAGEISLTAKLIAEFLILVLVANILMAPLAWIYGKQWLSSFAYHMDFNVSYIGFTLIATTLIAVFTIGFQAYRAGKVNPVETLQSE